MTTLLIAVPVGTGVTVTEVETSRTPVVMSVTEVDLNDQGLTGSLSRGVG